MELGHGVKKYVIAITPSIFELERQSKAQNVGKGMAHSM